MSQKISSVFSSQHRVYSHLSLSPHLSSIFPVECTGPDLSKLPQVCIYSPLQGPSFSMTACNSLQRTPLSKGRESAAGWLGHNECASFHSWMSKKKMEKKKKKINNFLFIFFPPTCPISILQRREECAAVWADFSLRLFLTSVRRPERRLGKTIIFLQIRDVDRD